MSYVDAPLLVAPSNGETIGPALASLPRYFRAGGSTAEIAIVDGRAPWVAPVEAALAERRRAVILLHPEWADPDAVSGLSRHADATGIPVMIDYPRASHPAVAAVAADWSTRIRPTGLLELTSLRAHETDAAANFLDDVAMIRALAGPLVSIQSWLREPDVYSAVAAVSVGSGLLRVACAGAAVDASAAATRIRWLGPDGALELEVVDDGTARPAQSRIVTTTGEVLAASIYESSTRATLLRLWAHLGADRGRCNDLGDLADGLALLTPLLT